MSTVLVETGGRRRRSDHQPAASNADDPSRGDGRRLTRFDDNSARVASYQPGAPSAPAPPENVPPPAPMDAHRWPEPRCLLGSPSRRSRAMPSAGGSRLSSGTISASRRERVFGVSARMGCRVVDLGDVASPHFFPPSPSHALDNDPHGTRSPRHPCHPRNRSCRASAPPARRLAHEYRALPQRCLRATGSRDEQGRSPDRPTRTSCTRLRRRAARARRSRDAAAVSPGAAARRFDK
jgi:hypothetical protein